jgi:hypothetical protein
MKIRHPLLHKLGALVGSAVIRRWVSTLECRLAYFDPAVDPVHPDFDGQKIFIFWHEYILGPLYMRGHCNLSMLVSRHRDAEILTHLARHLGFSFVRGSTTRGGVAALRELLRESRRMNLAITPDGPQGPRRVLAPGPVYLSSKLRLPLVALGVGYDRPWRMPTWDRFALPRPYSRARAVLGPQIQIPPDLDRDGLEHYRRQVEKLLNRLTEAAETWAHDDARMEGETITRRGPARELFRRLELDRAA